MFSIFSKKPKINNRPFEDLSLMLWQVENDKTYKHELLVPEKLDFSLESLKHIDDYLEAIHNEPPAEDEEIIKIAIRTGSYVGEVIRKNTNQFDWLEYKQAAKVDSMVKQLGMQLGTMAILWQEPNNILFPFSKILKYIENGNEDSVYAFGMGVAQLIKNDT